MILIEIGVEFELIAFVVLAVLIVFVVVALIVFEFVELDVFIVGMLFVGHIDD